jgi:hypothetical protein
LIDKLSIGVDPKLAQMHPRRIHNGAGETLERRSGTRRQLEVAVLGVAAFTALHLRPALRSVEDSQDDYLFLVSFVDGDERERRKRDLARALTRPRRPRFGNVSNVPMRSITDCTTRRAESGRSYAM